MTLRAGAMVMVGASNGSNASPGLIGEYITSTIALGSAVSLVTTVAATVTSIVLTAGDWDVSSVVDFHPGATTVTTYMQGGVSLVTATLGAQDSFFSNTFAIATTAIDASEGSPLVRINVSTTTTVYMIAVSGFTVSTMTAYGTIRARRVR